MNCPKCNHDKVAAGSILSQIDYFTLRVYFRPKGLRPFTLTGTDVGFKNQFFTCTKCGFLWSAIDAAKLVRIIAAKGKDKTKLDLGIATNESETEEGEE